jgi:hypothetical protein
MKIRLKAKAADARAAGFGRVRKIPQESRGVDGRNLHKGCTGLEQLLVASGQVRGQIGEVSEIVTRHRPGSRRALLADRAKVIGLSPSLKTRDRTTFCSLLSDSGSSFDRG